MIILLLLVGKLMVIRKKVFILKNFGLMFLEFDFEELCYLFFIIYVDIYSIILNVNSEGLKCCYNNMKFYWILV